MVLDKVLCLATLVMMSEAQLANQAQSFSSFTSGLVQSAAPLALAPASLTISHAPVLLKHAPEVEHYAPPHYEFKYGVKDAHTHDVKEQAEKRVGDRVEGHYSLLEPDGTTRTVHYTADKHTGFHAVVTRSGHAQHPSAPLRVAVPVRRVVSAPVLSFAQPAPALSVAAAPTLSLAAAPAFSLTASPSQIQGGATSFSTLSLLGK